MRWVFAPDEFTHVWQTETRLDRRPRPIDLAPRGTVTTESSRAALDLDHRFPVNGDPDLTGTLRFVARTDVTRLIAVGDPYDGATRVPDPILALGVVYSNWGAVIRATTSEVIVIACHSRRVATHLVDALGPAAPGREPTLRASRAAVLDPPPEIGGGPEPGDSAARLRRVLHSPIDARGFLTVTVAPENPMSPPPIHRTWLDITDDGRYLLSAGPDHISLTPVDESALTAHLTKLARIR